MAERSDKELQRYFDGELSKRAARRVHEKLSASEEDRLRLEALGQMRAMLRSAAEEAAEEADFSQLCAQVEREIARSPAEETSHAGRWLVRWGLVAASAAAAVILALVLWAPGPPEPPRNHCVIESLEVGAGATSTIFTIDDPELADATTVIWISEAQGDER